MINLPTVQAFLAPLIPGALLCLTMNIWYNGGAVGVQLTNCFDGFFVQVTVTCGRTLMDNLIVATVVSPRMYLDPLVLPDLQLLCDDGFLTCCMLALRF